MANQQYMELLRDPRWQRKRLEVFEIAEWKCQRCGETEREFHVHHFHYRNGVRPWEYGFDEMACVCSTCHEELSQQRAALKRALFAYESHFLPIDKLIKYIEAQTAWIDGKTVHVEGVTQALGVADAMGCKVDKVIAVVGADNDVDPLELEAITVEAPQMPDPANDNEGG